MRGPQSLRALGGEEGGAWIAPVARRHRQLVRVLPVGGVAREGALERAAALLAGELRERKVGVVAPVGERRGERQQERDDERGGGGERAARW